jgi:hypothetical protein
MQRQIYEVYAKVVDSTGAYNTLSGYPKVFDSRSYDNDIDKTLKRATGEFADTWGAFCKRDDHQLQMVLLMTASGYVIDKKCLGDIADLPDEES